MAQLTQIHLAHLPSEISIYAALFTSVTNAPFLRQQLLDGNTAFEYAFIDAHRVSYPFSRGLDGSVHPCPHPELRNKEIPET